MTEPTFYQTHIIKQDMHEIYANLFGRVLTNRFNILLVACKDDLDVPFEVEKDGKVKEIKRVRGKIIKSLEQFVELAETHTHFTPHTFNSEWRSYIDKNGERQNYIPLSSQDGFVSGHRKYNLGSITLVGVDFDKLGVVKSPQAILDYCREHGIPEPTVIVKTDKQDGYQAFYIFSTPIVLDTNRKRREQTIKMYEQLHETIRDAFEELQPDKGCLALGFYRVPRLANTKVYTGKYHNPNDLMVWAASRTKLEVVVSNDEQKQEQKEEGTKNEHENAIVAQYDLSMEWFQLLINCKNVPPGLRNKSVFTMALTFKQGEINVDTATQQLLAWNRNLVSPLDESEVVSAVTSAYTRPYRGPKVKYVRDIMDGVFKDRDVKVYNRIWVKHKKDRKDRVRSHFSEREEDLNSCLMECYREGYMNCEGYLKTTIRELAKKANMPKSTLEKLIKKSEHIYKEAHGKGGNAYILITSTDVQVALVEDMDIVSTDHEEKVKQKFKSPMLDIVYEVMEAKMYNVLHATNTYEFWRDYEVT